MSGRSRAFTLVELLVVIGIITVLVGILLPTLSKARAQAETVVCQSNVRQVYVAFLSYSIESKGYTPGNLHQGNWNLDWCGRNNAVYLQNPTAYASPMLTSVLNKYLPAASRTVLECPTAQRGANNLFDYTVLQCAGGAKTNLRWRVSYPTRPAQTFTPSPRAYMQGIPLIVEEHEVFYNSGVNDGSFSSGDQFSRRHRGKCSIAYLDGSIGLFQTIAGPKETIEEAGDLKCNQLLLHVGPATYPLTSSSVFGWMNQPQ